MSFLTIALVFLVISLLLVIVFSACHVAASADRGTDRDELVARSTNSDGSAPRLAYSDPHENSASTQWPSPQEQHSRT
jgi:hypothetical protein